MGLLYGVSHRNKEGQTEAEFYFSEQNRENKVSKTYQVRHDDDEQPRKVTKLDHSLIMKNVTSCRTFLVGSCNGLVCYACDAGSMTGNRKIYICNPITGEQRQFKNIVDCGNNAYLECAIGFGYNRSSNEYKVVRILRSSESQDKVMIWVLTFSSGKWRNKRIMIENHHLTDLRALPSPGVFVCGSLHWIEEYSMKPKTIAFDLKSETLEVLPSIPSAGSNTKHGVGLMDLGGNLCVLEVVPGKHVNIWESSKYRQDKLVDGAPWVMKFSIAWEDYSWFEPFALRKSHDKCLLWYNAVLSCYDPETNNLRKLNETLKQLMDDDCRLPACTSTRATPHVNTLVSVKENVEASRGKKRNVEERGGKKRKAPEETGKYRLLSSFY